MTVKKSSFVHNFSKSQLWNLFLKFLKNWEKNWWKGRRYPKKIIFTKKWCFFVFEFVLYFFLALFWGILLSFMRDVQILSYFCLKCLFLPLYFWQSSWQKLWYIKICYWCLWTAGDQKIRYRSFLSSKTSSYASELAKTDQGP